jgi:hypothetical protein
MRPWRVWWMLAVACAPSAASRAVSEVTAPGDGPVLLASLPSAPGVRLTYLITREAPDSGVAPDRQEAFYGTPATLPDGTPVSRYVTPLEVVYQQIDDTALTVWGSSVDGVLEHPQVLLSYPLKAGRRWTSGDPSTPAWYKFQVEGIEEVTTPAGRFDAVRVNMLNTKTNESVQRWYAPGVGLVVRSGGTRLEHYVVPGGGS